MTRDELIAKLTEMIAGNSRTAYGEGWTDGINAALRHVEKLDSPPAMAWQDEPSGEGWHFVRQGGRKFLACRVLAIPGKGWYCDGAGGVRPLNGRRVCPIPAPPALPKRKEGE